MLYVCMMYIVIGILTELCRDNKNLVNYRNHYVWKFEHIMVKINLLTFIFTRTKAVKAETEKLFESSTHPNQSTHV